MGGTIQLVVDPDAHDVTMGGQGDGAPGRKRASVRRTTTGDDDDDRRLGDDPDDDEAGRRRRPDDGPGPARAHGLGAWANDDDDDEARAPDGRAMVGAPGPTTTTRAWAP